MNGRDPVIKNVINVWSFMVRKINKRSVYYIKSFVNSVGLSDAGIALFTYLPTLSLCRVIVSQEKDKMIMLSPADLFFFCSFLAVLMSFLWILYCTLESKTTERIYCAQFTVSVMSCFPYKNKTCALSFRVLWSQITWFPPWVRSGLKWSFYSGVYVCA